MKVIAILSQKGGVGKTTLATCLAVAAEADGKTVALLDLDPQATACLWSDEREAETPTVSSLQAVRLGAVIAAAKKHGTDMVIIDGAAVARDVAQLAAEHADFVLIPTRATMFDTLSMGHTLGIVQKLGKPASVVLTFVSPQGREAGEVIEGLNELGAEVCPVTIGNRKAYYRAQANGLAAQEFEPKGAAADEIDRLYKYTSMQVYGGPKESAP